MTLKQHKQLAAPGRFLLPGVPRVGFFQGGDRCPEDVPFPACMRACLDYFKESLGYHLIASHQSTWRLDDTYTFLMGVSGCAFRLPWQVDQGATSAKQAVFTSESSALYRRAFEAFGYELIQVNPYSQGEDSQCCRREIIHSLFDQGRPVIAFGVIGPPEACLITGYEDFGDVIIGWDFYQDFPEYSGDLAYEASGEFRKRDWVSNTLGLLVFGKRQPAALNADSYREALRWALRIMYAPAAQVDSTQPANHNGLAAYHAWADALLTNEDDLTELDILRERFMAHDHVVNMVAEGRWYAARFMELAAAMDPTHEEDLFAAAECFETEHDLMWKIWGLVGGNGCSDDHVRKLAEPAVRQRIAQIILQASEKDREAAGWIEQALNR